MKTVDFSETIAASDLKVARCRQLIEFMKLCEYRRSSLFLFHGQIEENSGKIIRSFLIY